MLEELETGTVINPRAAAAEAETAPQATSSFFAAIPACYEGESCEEGGEGEGSGSGGSVVAVGGRWVWVCGVGVVVGVMGGGVL